MRMNAGGWAGDSRDTLTRTQKTGMKYQTMIKSSLINQTLEDKIPILD